MAALRTEWVTTNRPESSVVLLGLLLAVFGLALGDTHGIASILAASGLALCIAGSISVATAGARSFRAALAIVGLVAAQLLAFSGVIRWVGGIAVGIVVVTVAISRL